MKKNTFNYLNLLKPIHLLLLLLIGSPLIAQVSPPQILSDARSFEVSACMPGKGKIVTAWMEKRAERKDNSEEAADMRIAYRSSENDGKEWTEKGIIDMPNTFATGNPFVMNTDKGETYMVCMHINKDFYSGNISLYQFDFEKKKFYLKSIPIKSGNRLLDKPSIAASGNQIHLVYVSYDDRFNTAVKYQMSDDKGETWTEPVNVFSDSTIKYLGPGIVLSKTNQVIISAGSYMSKNIYVIKKRMGAESIAFENPMIVSKVSGALSSAMTQLSGTGNKLILTWQNPHQRSETWLTYSGDEGNNWAEPYLVTTKGNLLSAVFDQRGNLHCIYSDFSNNRFFVGYKLLSNTFKLLKESYLSTPKPLAAFTEYLGAYQQLLIKKDELFAFWIDYPENSTLNFTKWKF